jgi:hypothetical protein
LWQRCPDKPTDDRSLVLAMLGNARAIPPVLTASHPGPAVPTRSRTGIHPVGNFTQEMPAIEHDGDWRSDECFCGGSVFTRGTGRASHQQKNRYELDTAFTDGFEPSPAHVRQTYCLGTKIRTAAGCDPRPRTARKNRSRSGEKKLVRAPFTVGIRSESA